MGVKNGTKKEKTKRGEREKEGGGDGVRRGGGFNKISVKKLSKPGEDQRRLENFLQRRPLRRRTRGTTKEYEAKENKYRGNMEEAPCGLIIRATLQVTIFFNSSAL